LTFYRNVQRCSVLQINNLPFTLTNQPTKGTVTSSVPGLEVELKALISPVQQTATGKNQATDCSAATSTPAPSCVYSLLFSLNKIPATGVTNQQVTVNINQGTTVIATLVATINLNCAPVFQTLVASVGVTPALVSETTFRLGTEIVAVLPPSKNPASATVQATTPAILSQYIANYNIPKGVGETGDPLPTNAIAAPAVAPKKVYVNCIKDQNPATMGGTTILGRVTVRYIPIHAVTPFTPFSSCQ
jgi:hypothetical protein